MVQILGPLRESRPARILWLSLAWCSLGLGTAGIVLPLLPTTPFVLLAAWAAPKGSPRLHAWLHAHHRFGPLLRAWRDEGAVPRRAKVITPLLLLSSWALLWSLAAPAAVLGATGILFVAVGAYVTSRPTARRKTL